jgi:hypothetical protein
METERLHDDCLVKGRLDGAQRLTTMPEQYGMYRYGAPSTRRWQSCRCLLDNGEDAICQDPDPGEPYW